MLENKHNSYRYNSNKRRHKNNKHATPTQAPALAHTDTGTYIHRHTGIQTYSHAHTYMHTKFHTDSQKERDRRNPHAQTTLTQILRDIMWDSEVYRQKDGQLDRQRGGEGKGEKERMIKTHSERQDKKETHKRKAHANIVKEIQQRKWRA